MRRFVLVIVVLVFAACTNTDRVLVSNNSATLKNANDSISSFLYDFYTFYIHKCFEENGSFRDMQHELQTYCTPKFLRTILEDDEIDCDPFIEAQDIVENWRQTMTVQKHNSDNDMYVICLWRDEYARKDHCVKVFLVQNEGNWKIDDVKVLNTGPVGRSLP